MALNAGRTDDTVAQSCDGLWTSRQAPWQDLPVVITCPDCNARVEVKVGAKTARCDYCGGPLPVPAASTGNPIADTLGKMFEDKDGDGVPDVFQAMGSAGAVSSVRQVSVQHQEHYVVNGKEYASLEQMPPEVRRVFERTRGMLDGAMRTAGSSSVKMSTSATHTASAPMASGSAAPARSSMLTVVVALVVALAAAVGIAVFLALR